MPGSEEENRHPKNFPENSTARQQLATAKQQYESLFGSEGLAAARESAAQSIYNQRNKQYDSALILARDGGYLSQAELDGRKAELD